MYEALFGFTRRLALPVMGSSHSIENALGLLMVKPSLMVPSSKSTSNGMSPLPLHGPVEPLDDDDVGSVPDDDEVPDEPDELVPVPTCRVAVRSPAFGSIFPPQARKTREAAKAKRYGDIAQL
jgi:hypothetical protein